jgi:hypothetical protein
MAAVPTAILNPQLGLEEFDTVTTAVDMLMQGFDAPSADKGRRFAVKWHDIYGPRNLSHLHLFSLCSILSSSHPRSMKNAAFTY